MTILQKLRALAATEAKAIEAPWTVKVGEGYANVEAKHFTVCSEVDNGTAALIADSRNLLPALIRLVEAQHEALEDLYEAEWMVSVDWATHARRASVLEPANAALALANQEHP